MGIHYSRYEGPASFVTYLTTRASKADIDMIALVAEVPAYLQGYKNPEAVPYDLDADPKGILKRTWPSSEYRALQFALKDTPEECPEEKAYKAHLDSDPELRSRTEDALKNGLPTG